MADIEQAKATFARFDQNGDGLVTAEEFKHAMAEMGDPYVTGPVAEAVIKARDTDDDGLMSFDEFWTALQKA
ncbi:EF-hand domain-containing protein [Streptomyces sp. CA-132043]|uniref:EF-hand domain-containing protein n=1 Tax=Streptomyces sp. CA-132043 TaxID=3240048 RepID=UPI003D912652